MGRRKQAKVLSHCVVCGDEATGFFFNALTCMSCRVFFRRNALRYRVDQLSCSHGKDECHIDLHTRRHCTKCRLKKCLNFGMKKEWILTENDKQALYCRKKVLLNRIQQELESNEDCTDDFQDHKNDQIDQEYINSIVDEYCDRIVLNNGIINVALNSEQEIESLQSNLNFLPNIESLQMNANGEQLNKDFITQCLMDENFLDSAMESINCIHLYGTVPPELDPFPSQELIELEKQFLRELSAASTMLSNPYRKIVDYGTRYSPLGAHPLSQYTLERFVHMASRLHTFTGLSAVDQNKLIKNRLLEMFSIRSVVIYDPDRNGFGIVDDKNKVTAMVSLQILSQFCSESKMKNLYRQFRDEWKRDDVICSLLTVINLFTPNEHYTDYSRINNEHTRYCRLLSRYLTIKYRKLEEAEQCYYRLKVSLDELLQLSVGLRSLFIVFNQCQIGLNGTPLFSQFLDL